MNEIFDLVTSQISAFATEQAVTKTLATGGVCWPIARFKVTIGAVGDVYGRYFDENGFIGYSKKIIDSNFYQDYSYSLRSSKQLNEYGEIVKKLLHPIGTKLFGEFRPQGESLNFSFDNMVVMEDGSFLQIENSFDKIKTEQYFEPTHNVALKTINDATSSLGLTITGGSNLVFDPDNTENLPQDFPANSMVVIDDEQAFMVSYGELKMENFLNGSVSTDSLNAISRFIVNNTTSSFTVSEDVTQTKSDNTVVKGKVLSQELNQFGNTVLLLHTCNGNFEATSNISFGSHTANLFSVDSNVIFGNTLSVTLSPVSNLIRNDTTLVDATVVTERPHNLRQKDRVIISGVNKSTWNGTYTINVIDDKTFSYRAFHVLAP